MSLLSVGQKPSVTYRFIFDETTLAIALKPWFCLIELVRKSEQVHLNILFNLSDYIVEL